MRICCDVTLAVGEMQSIATFCQHSRLSFNRNSYMIYVLRSLYYLPGLYSYCNSFFIHGVHGEFGLINVYLFDILPAISSRKVVHFLL